MKLNVEIASEGTQRKKIKLWKFHFYLCVVAIYFSKLGQDMKLPFNKICSYSK